MTLNAFFRIRYREMHIRKQLEALDPLQYIRIVCNNNQETAKALFQVAGGKPERRFEDMVNREDNVHRWADFISHEQKKNDSKWKDLRDLPAHLAIWRKALEADSAAGDRDMVVTRVNDALKGNNLAILSVEERIQTGLRAFRFMLRRLWR